jgi:DNA-binding MarR family transcriptional regulator
MSKDDNSLDNQIRDLWILLNHTTRAISRQREAELDKFGLSVERYAILHILMYQDGLSIDEIAIIRLREHHSVFTLVNRMEKIGLVNKVKYPKSKAYKIFITDKARDIYNRVTINTLKDAFSALSPDDQQKLAQYLKLLLVRSMSHQGFDFKLTFSL